MAGSFSLDDMVSQFSEIKLLENRTIFISEGINPSVAKRVVSQLLTMDTLGHDPINLFVNSPGGEVNSGFAIYDTIRFIASPVRIINTGLCASIATIINCAATKENRFTMANCKFLIHQPLIPGQIQGQASDLEITAKEILKTRAKLNGILSDACDQPLERVEKDTTRDYWMSAEEALDYGLVTNKIESIADLS